jgi:hypothetical protein
VVQGAVQHHHPDRQPGVSASQLANVGPRQTHGHVGDQVEDHFVTGQCPKLGDLIYNVGVEVKRSHVHVPILKCCLLVLRSLCGTEVGPDLRVSL